MSLKLKCILITSLIIYKSKFQYIIFLNNNNNNNNNNKITEAVAQNLIKQKKNWEENFILVSASKHA